MNTQLNHEQIVNLRPKPIDINNGALIVSNGSPRSDQLIETVGFAALKGFGFRSDELYPASGKLSDLETVKLSVFIEVDPYLSAIKTQREIKLVADSVDAETVVYITNGQGYVNTTGGESGVPTQSIETTVLYETELSAYIRQQKPKNYFTIDLGGGFYQLVTLVI